MKKIILMSLLLGAFNSTVYARTYRTAIKHDIKTGQTIKQDDETARDLDEIEHYLNANEHYKEDDALNAVLGTKRVIAEDLDNKARDEKFLTYEKKNLKTQKSEYDNNKQEENSLAKKEMDEFLKRRNHMSNATGPNNFLNIYSTDSGEQKAPLQYARSNIAERKNIENDNKLDH